MDKCIYKISIWTDECLKKTPIVIVSVSPHSPFCSHFRVDKESIRVYGIQTFFFQRPSFARVSTNMICSILLSTPQNCRELFCEMFPSGTGESVVTYVRLVYEDKRPTNGNTNRSHRKLTNVQKQSMHVDKDKASGVRQSSETSPGATQIIAGSNDEGCVNMCVVNITHLNKYDFKQVHSVEQENKSSSQYAFNSNNSHLRMNATQLQHNNIYLICGIVLWASYTDDGFESVFKCVCL